MRYVKKFSIIVINNSVAFNTEGVAATTVNVAVSTDPCCCCYCFKVVAVSGADSAAAAANVAALKLCFHETDAGADADAGTDAGAFVPFPRSGRRRGRTGVDLPLASPAMHYFPPHSLTFREFIIN